jgi:LysR family transcriptional regulator, carnitine catabolism transcriptional activator
MELRQLAYFLAVADQGGFTAAADTAGVTQPALSLAVRNLEAELGTPLFLRLGRRVALTAAGRALAGPARRAVRDAEAGRAAVTQVHGLEAGELTLCCLPTLAPDPLAGLVGAFRSAHPGVVVELAAPEDTGELLALLSDGRCEIGVGERLEPHVGAAGLRQHGLGAQRLVVILPAGGLGLVEVSERGGDLRCPLGALGGVPLVATPPGTSSRRLLDDGLAAAGIEGNVAVVTAQREAVVPLVVAGAGAALVPESLARTARALGAVVARPDPPVLRHTVLVHRDDALTPAAQRFAELALGQVSARAR